MNTTDYESGWAERVWVQVKRDSTLAFINEFRCKVSGSPLEEECLMVSRTNFKHRGNETDELHYYNRYSTPEKYMEVWENWDKTKFSKIEEIRGIMREYNITIKLIEL